MKAQKKPDAGDTRQEQTQGKDMIFQPIGRNCSLDRLAKKYYTGFDKFCQDNPAGTPISVLRDLWDMIFESMHLVSDGGG